MNESVIVLSMQRVLNALGLPVQQTTGDPSPLNLGGSIQNSARCLDVLGPPGWDPTGGMRWNADCECVVAGAWCPGMQNLYKDFSKCRLALKWWYALLERSVSETSQQSAGGSACCKTGAFPLRPDGLKAPSRKVVSPCCGPGLVASPSLQELRSKTSWRKTGTWPSLPRKQNFSLPWAQKACCGR